MLVQLVAPWAECLSNSHRCGRCTSNIVDIDLLVNCGGQESLTNHSYINTHYRSAEVVQLTLARLPNDSLAARLVRKRLHTRKCTIAVLTPDSPERAIVREQIPLQASQKRISWSYEPVTSITDMSGTFLVELELKVGAGIVRWHN